ncbi:MAG: 6,7-dimethyl-8-ribityllumazine synthase [Thalassobaculaceae bacterium]
MATATRAALGDAKVAIVQACWHKDLVDRCRDACLTALAAGGVSQVVVIDVPGSFEIPLQAKRCADQGRYDAIIAMGLVVDGGIYAHEFVGRAVIDGLMRVQLASGTPVLSAVLTPRAFHESDAHQAFFHDHLALKGEEVAAACLWALGQRAAA